MLKSLHNALLEWYRGSTDRQKVQHAYITIFILSIVVAGIVSLVDNATGQDLLIIPFIAGSIFVVNGVLWALFESFLLNKLSGKHKK